MLVIGNLWIAVCSPVSSFVRCEMHVLLLRNSITDTKIQKSQQQPLFQLTARNLKLLFYFVFCRLFVHLSVCNKDSTNFHLGNKQFVIGSFEFFLLLKSTFRNQPAELLFTNEVLLVSSEDSQLNYLSLIEFYAYYSQDNFLLLSVTPIQNFKFRQLTFNFLGLSYLDLSLFNFNPSTLFLILEASWC